MRIRDMFLEDINRRISGVIKVDQSDEEIIYDEIREYVITSELKKHFITFFNNYSDAFHEPTADIGVWISGFFGSGKSHFLKMLSYLLENREVKGIKTIEQFRSKFADDPGTFMMIDQATRGETETILFNIDVEGFSEKDKTAVLKVFAKMFYNHLGFFGQNRKVVTLERQLHLEGKTEEFRQTYERKSGKAWVEDRGSFDFRGRFVVPTMVDVLGMSEADAQAWFNDKEEPEITIANLVDDIKEYVSKKPPNYRLLFMIDEAGQYVGTDTDMLLNLQSLTEKIGSECQGKVWVVCTGQEAIDEIIKVRVDEFSRIQARFKTRLSLSSSSVDEVIQERILKKKPDVFTKLEQLYDRNASVLRNLFSFTDSVLDIKGYTGPREFATDFPFVPYQFIIMQKVFTEIRKRGAAGKHLSGGERSMLSGFKEAAQKVQNENEYTLVPFFHFYDTVHSFLDGSIRRVIERCQRAATSGAGIEIQDVDVLKLLYLVRYVDDIKANLDNIVILMADDIRMDKVKKRISIRDSLDRLMRQNYIARTGDAYFFLTDEEQNIQREINNTPVDTSAIVKRIGEMIFGEIYTTNKFRYSDKHDFPFDKKVDGTAIGVLTGGMQLKFISVAADASVKHHSRLMIETKSDRAVAVVLAETPYYDTLERAMKIRLFVKQKNVREKPKSIQTIINNQQEKATMYEQQALDELRQAIEDAVFYADGEKLDIKGGDAKSKIDTALEYLVSHLYSELDLVDWYAKNEIDIRDILLGRLDDALAVGMTRNQRAADKMYEFLELQDRKQLPTSMADIQSRFSAIPYGWRELDIAAVAAKLIYEQKATVKYAGTTIRPDDPKLPDMLHKKSEVGKAYVRKRHKVSEQNRRASREFLRAYFEVMDVPEDEDGMVHFIVEKFSKIRQRYSDLLARYQGRQYPDRSVLEDALSLIDNVLSQQKDNEALVSRLLDKENDLEDNKEDLAGVEEFFNSQVDTFDRAVRFNQELEVDFEYISKDVEAKRALDAIRAIITLPEDGRYKYRRIPELNALMDTVSASHDRMLDEKRKELIKVVRQCLSAIRQRGDRDSNLRSYVTKADDHYRNFEERIARTDKLALLDGMMPRMWDYKDDVLREMDDSIRPQVSPFPFHDDPEKAPVKKNIKPLYRQAIFPARLLETEDEVNAYVDQIKRQLLSHLRDSDAVEIK